MQSVSMKEDLLTNSIIIEILFKTNFSVKEQQSLPKVTSSREGRSMKLTRKEWKETLNSKFSYIEKRLISKFNRFKCW